MSTHVLIPKSTLESILNCLKCDAEKGDGDRRKILGEIERFCKEYPQDVPKTPWARWFPTDLLGNPMREYSPNKWEIAHWPSELIVDDRVYTTAAGNFRIVGWTYEDVRTKSRELYGTLVDSIPIVSCKMVGKPTIGYATRAEIMQEVMQATSESRIKSAQEIGSAFAKLLKSQTAIDPEIAEATAKGFWSMFEEAKGTS